MNKQRYYYLIEFQYMGFRYHGWQKQEGVKTVQGMIDRTLNYVLDGQKFRTIAAGRTDAMVSVKKSYFELFTFHELEDSFFDYFNENLPSDIRALSIKQVDSSFNIIQGKKVKEYVYHFTYGTKIHPFAAPFVVHFQEQLDVDLMKKAVKIYEGKYDYKHYCYKPKPETKTEREILSASLEGVQPEFGFSPENTFVFKVKGEGFMRYQVRLMMGMLVRLGRGEVTLEHFEATLRTPEQKEIEFYVAPASGLMLADVVFEDL